MNIQPGQTRLISLEGTIRSESETPVNDGSLGSMMRGNADGGRNALRSRGNGIRKKQDHGDWRILVGNINTFPREHGGEGKAKLHLI